MSFTVTKLIINRYDEFVFMNVQCASLLVKFYFFRAEHSITQNSKVYLKEVGANLQ